MDAVQPKPSYTYPIFFATGTIFLLQGLFFIISTQTQLPNAIAPLGVWGARLGYAGLIVGIAFFAIGLVKRPKELALAKQMKAEAEKREKEEAEKLAQLAPIAKAKAEAEARVRAEEEERARIEAGWKVLSQDDERLAASALLAHRSAWMATIHKQLLGIEGGLKIETIRRQHSNLKNFQFFIRVEFFDKHHIQCSQDDIAVSSEIIKKITDEECRDAWTATFHKARLLFRTLTKIPGYYFSKVKIEVCIATTSLLNKEFDIQGK